MEDKGNKKTRNRGYYRRERIRHINRKKNIIKRVSAEGYPIWHYKYEGELSKGKIHCSCKLCQASRGKGRKSPSTRRREDVLIFSEKEYIEEAEN